MDTPDTHGPLRPGLLPGGGAALDDDDLEWAQYVAWADLEVAAGRGPEPEPWPAGNLEPWDPEAGDPGIPGPVRAGAPRPLFAEGGAADVMAPSPFLAALTEQAAVGVAGLSDSELVGVLRASRRLVAREQYKQVLAAAEFGRRRQAAFNDALRRGVPAGCAAGGFPGEELAVELVMGRGEAGCLIDDGIYLTSRLPRTLAQMAAGLVDAGKAGWIALYTRSLGPADAACADELLAGEAPELRDEQLARKAAALEMKLNPEGVKARRERARRDGQRVEARREASGNASLAGRELDVADVLAAKAYLDAVAARLREGGLPGSLDRLRAVAMTDLTQGRNPLDRIPLEPQPADPAPGQPAAPSSCPPPAPPSGPGHGQPTAPPPPGPPPGPPHDTRPADDGTRNPPRPAAAAPVPALVNLIVPAATLLGLATTPAQAGPWGLLDAGDTRTLTSAAAAHPATRWCLTLTAPDGTAVAHGCARGPRPRLLDDLGPQPPPAPGSPSPPPSAPAPQPPRAHLAELLRRLNITLTPIARDASDHTIAENGYVPSRKLRHLVRARTATCDAPGCPNPAVSADLDHTIPWPAGPTDQGNLAPRCRTHHRAKQAPDWTVEQLAPGVIRWTLPTGRTHITAPTRYDT